MCCFSRPVEQVTGTNIFAGSSNGSQFLVYSMSYSAKADLAMVLPLPIPRNSSEDAVRFISLEGYPQFFDDMRKAFPPRWDLVPRSASWTSRFASQPKLKVHAVGSFEASFVPRLDDFARLDERFRIANDVWDQIPSYRDDGFAVFQLQRTLGSVLGRLLGGRTLMPRTVHPMALEFPRRNPELLYFPTVHVHDGKVHSHAMFDHMLYCQPDSNLPICLDGWERSRGPMADSMNINLSSGTVEPIEYCWRRPLQGQLQNKDTLLGIQSELPNAGPV